MYLCKCIVAKTAPNVGEETALQELIGKVDSINYLKRFWLQSRGKTLETSLGGSLVRRNRRTLSSYFVSG
jgi:hypothetical protein